VFNRSFVIALGLIAGAASVTAIAQARQRIERAADLPRFSYPISGKLEQVVRDAAAFASLAAAVRRDTESVLASYDIADKAARRQLLGVLTQLDYLEGRYDDALKRTAEIRALQDKPADKLLSGYQMRAMIAARQGPGNTTTDAWRKAVAAAIGAELKAMPYEVIANDVKSSKGRFETLGETLLLGGVREVLQPAVDKTGALSSDLAPRVIGARYGLIVSLPLKQTLIDVLAAYLAVNKVDKPDIWAARNVELPAGRGYAPVRIAVWDSGADTALFRDQVVRDGDGKPAVIAFDRYSNPATGELRPLSPEMQSRLPKMRARTKGFSDLRSNIDSPEASEVKAYLSGLKADEYKSAIEEISLAGSYSHGTHVSGIALAGNPYARLVVARIEFNDKLLPDPCPSREQSEKSARTPQAYVDFLKAHGVRVVNMSWGGNVLGYEGALELCGIGKNADERKALAREYFDLAKASLTKAIESVPEIMFVASGGNSNQDASFAEAIPSGIVLPNLVTVGAVDKAGDEASFTSYGPTVVLHANGYQVESFIPGGDRVALSGTSMSAPQVTNLAAKMLAVNPKLTPVELIAIIRETAEKTTDGRRILIHPAKAMAAAQKRA
jgi:subtilisin family serine protease